MTYLMKDLTRCPQCGRTASGRPFIQSFFGFRKMEDGITRVQSWCKPCRNKPRAQKFEIDFGDVNF